MPRQRRYYSTISKTILLVLLLMVAIAVTTGACADGAEWNYNNEEEGEVDEGGGGGRTKLSTPTSLPQRLRREAAAAAVEMTKIAAADSTRRSNYGNGGNNMPASPYPLLLDDVDVSISLMGSYNSLPDLLDDQNRPLPPQQHPMGSSSIDQHQRTAAAAVGSRDGNDDNGSVDHNHDSGGFDQETTAGAAGAEAAFIGALETNVTVGLGQTAFLRCRLKNTQHQVTWIRMRDWHILTSGLLTYTADARFRVKHQSQPVQPPPSASIVPSRPDVSEWTLEIKFLQARDEGTYYCQIPTRTGTMVHAFHLFVASPQAVILGGQVSHVDILTPSLTLVCIVDNTPDPPQVIFWYHNGTLLKDGKYPETGGSGASGVLSSHLTLTSSRTMSMLTLQNIQHVHSGNYTCRAPNAEPDTTQLFVTQRHEQAAVHRSNWPNSSARNRLETSSMLTIGAVTLLVVTVRRK